MVRASYAIIPIGLAGVPAGVVQALEGYPAIGLIVAVMGTSAAALAVAKLRALKRWPFNGRDTNQS
jgi:hypothetical protein